MRAAALLAALLAAGLVALAPRGLAEIDFRRAESHYRRGDVANARMCCESALRRRPDHARARALMWILQPRPRCDNGDRLLLDIADRTNESGYRFLDVFELEAAEKGFLLALELVDLVRPNPGSRAREDTARAGLERIAAMREGR